MSDFLTEFKQYMKRDLSAPEQLRLERIKKGQESFWEYCKTVNPDFFKESRPHLKTVAETLQALSEGRVRKFSKEDNWKIYTPEEIDAIFAEAEKYLVCKKIIINIPPRHGKSYMLTLFTQWLLGRDNSRKIITVSYNEILAGRFAANVRDGIDATKIDEKLIIFADIFPATKIKAGDGAKQIWALEGSHFNYLGTGFGGTITGIGCNVGIVDDPIKNAAEAYNDNALEAQWTWYTDTFLSRIEEGGIQIINMTRWASKDLCGRILDSEEADEWYKLEMKACIDEKQGIMLCPDLLSFESYLSKKRMLSPAICEANYQQQPVDIQGALYGEFKTYDAVDESRFERIINYTDTADEGSDSLASFSGGIIDGYIYITDIYCTDEPMEVTEPELARRLDIYRIRESIIESNNGGRGFARNVIAKLKARKNKRCHVTWFHQTKNKRTRILVNASSVMEKVIMPEGWEKKYPEAYKALMGYQRKGKNAHDDVPDGLTGLLEFAIGEVKGKKKARVGNRRRLGL